MSEEELRRLKAMVGNFENDECKIYPTHWAELPKPPSL